TAKDVRSLYEWVERIKTKRYTWTRIQRIFVHLLTNTKKSEIEVLSKSIPYIRLLGMTSKVRDYLNKVKKDLRIAISPKLTRELPPLLQVEERASNAYYSILPIESRYALMKQELRGPIIV